MLTRFLIINKHDRNTILHFIGVLAFLAGEQVGGIIVIEVTLTLRAA